MASFDKCKTLIVISSVFFLYWLWIFIIGTCIDEAKMSLSKKRYTSISGAYLSDSVKKSNFKHDICIYILSDLQWLLCEMEKYLEKKYY